MSLSSDFRSGLSFLEPFISVDPRAARRGRRPPKSAVVFARDRAFNSSGAAVDGVFIPRLPIAWDRWLIGQREVCLALIDFLSLICVLIDNGLEQNLGYWNPIQSSPFQG